MSAHDPTPPATTMSHHAAVDATTCAVHTSADKCCLDDDGVCLNATIFEGVHYPTARAARIARDALRAAQQYYQLFYECDCGACNINDGTASAPPSTTSLAAAATRTPASAESNTNDATASEPSCRHHHAVHMHRITAQQTAMYYARTPTSTAMSLSTHTSPNVLDSAYHTFFPPVLSQRHRERIIEKILGHAPSPYGRWTWHKAAAYATIPVQQAHASALPSAQRQLEQTAPQHQRQSLPSLQLPSIASASNTGLDVSTSSNHAHLSQTRTRDSTSSHASAAAASAVAATTMTTGQAVAPPPLYFPLVPHTVIQHPHTQQLTHVPATTQKQQQQLADDVRVSDNKSRNKDDKDGVGSGGGGGDADEAGKLSRLHAARPSVSSHLLTASSTRVASVAHLLPPVTASACPAAETSSTSVQATTAATPTMGDAVIYSFPTSQQGPEYFHAAAEDGTRTMILIMVGLPARGKTFLAQKICRLLSWHGCKATVHNLQVVWRRKLAEALASSDTARQGVGVAATRDDGTERDAGDSATTGDDAAAGGHAGKAKPGRRGDVAIRAEHFAQLLSDAESVPREVYRSVLRSTAEDCREFFARGGGEVAILNDDFVTESLRCEAEAVLRPLASQLIFMEVVRDAAANVPFNECKVRDPAEYPPDKVAANEARADFAQRLALLERAYEPLLRLCDEDDEAATSATASPPPTRDSDTNARDVRTRGVHSGAGAALDGAAPARSRVRRRRACIKVCYPDVVEVHGVTGYAASRIVSYVMNITQAKMQHPIYFVRHGESCYNLEDRIGGDPLLTAQGMRDAAALLEFLYSLKTQLRRSDGCVSSDACGCGGGGGVAARGAAVADAHAASRLACRSDDCAGAHGGVAPCGMEETLRADEGHGDGDADVTMSAAPRSPSFAAAPATAATTTTTTRLPSRGDELEIWTSQLRRAIQTAELSERLLNIRTLRWSSLNEIHAGVCEGMTYRDVMTRYPLIDQFRKRSKYTFRYPDGESYQDLVVRLEPVIMELENANKVVVVVAHQAVLRCLLAYFGSTSAESSVRVRVPHRTVWRCTYNSKGIASLDELTLDNTEVGFAWRGKIDGAVNVADDVVHDASAGTACAGKDEENGSAGDADEVDVI